MTEVAKSSGMTMEEYKKDQSRRRAKRAMLNAVFFIVQLPLILANILLAAVVTVMVAFLALEFVTFMVS
jgi:uncharacterized membrane protein